MLVWNVTNRMGINSSVDIRSKMSTYCVVWDGMLCIHWLYVADMYYEMPIVTPNVKGVCCAGREDSPSVWVKHQWQECRRPQCTGAGQGGEYQRATPSFSKAWASLWGSCTIQTCRWLELFVTWSTKKGLLAAQYMHLTVGLQFYSFI